MAPVDRHKDFAALPQKIEKGGCVPLKTIVS